MFLAEDCNEALGWDDAEKPSIGRHNGDAAPFLAQSPRRDDLLVNVRPDDGRRLVDKSRHRRLCFRGEQTLERDESDEPTFFAHSYLGRAKKGRADESRANVAGEASRGRSRYLSQGEVTRG